MFTVKMETKLEQFVINHFDAIGGTIIVLFGAAALVAGLFDNIVLIIIFLFLMFGCVTVAMNIMGAPARRQMDAWRKNEALREENQRWNSKPRIKE